MEITCQQLAARLNHPTQDKPRVVDCRESDELNICHIEGAEHCPLSKWGEHWRQWFPDPKQEIVIICHHGMRSLKATVFLRERGYAETQSMAGGVDVWAQSINPSMARY